MQTDPIYSFEVPRCLLQAVALFQSEDETRFVLSTTKFEIRKFGDNRYELTLVATDGRRLAVHCDEIASDNLLTALPEGADFSIDLRAVGKLPKVKGEEGRLITCHVFERHAELTCGRYACKAKFVCGASGDPALMNFPAWKSVLPSTQSEPVKAFAFSSTLFDDFAKAGELLTASEAVIIHGYRGGECYSVQFPGYRQFFGVLMPVKLDTESTRPLWSVGAEVAAEAVAARAEA